ncbi:MAG: purine-nucleoside phosphorylase [delta proteobacterium ML8_F1]|nr:MAG: purine-nucleoside phosphorylase [delta proteobacterium ML8_F1]
MTNKVENATNYIMTQLDCSEPIEAALILGSGLGVLAEEITEPVVIPYEDIPHFPRSTVEGHKGQFVVGRLQGRRIMAMQGRVHFYEGYPMAEITFPVRIFKALGIRTLILTNAAGGVNVDFVPGDLMLIKDHINFAFDNPLIGPNDSFFGPRFPDTSRVYTKELAKLAASCAKHLGLSLKKGVYLFNTGPTYETPAEVQMARILGADAVGMSTVPEAIAAAHSGMRVLGISLITNMAAGILDQPLSHDEVVETAQRVKASFSALVKLIVERMEDND